MKKVTIIIAVLIAVLISIYLIKPDGYTYDSTCKKYIIEHYEEITTSEVYSDEYIFKFKIDTCTLNYWNNITIINRYGLSSKIIFKGDTNSWQSLFRGDEKVLNLKRPITGTSISFENGDRVEKPFYFKDVDMQDVVLFEVIDYYSKIEILKKLEKDVAELQSKLDTLKSQLDE